MPAYTKSVEKREKDKLQAIIKVKVSAVSWNTIFLLIL